MAIKMAIPFSLRGGLVGIDWRTCWVKGILYLLVRGLLLELGLWLGLGPIDTEGRTHPVLHQGSAKAWG